MGYILIVVAANNKYNCKTTNTRRHFMTTDELIQKHWNYYLMLEQKLLETRNYVEFCKKNFNTSSNEFCLLIISIGAELDNFLKTYCKIAVRARNNKTNNMKKYSAYLSAHYPAIATEEITVMNTDPCIILSPFDNLSSGKQFSWWEAYNAVKHNRYKSFKDAKLINAITILSALYLLEMKMFKEIYQHSRNKTHAVDCPLNQSKLFKLKKWNFNCSPGSDLVVVSI